MSESLKIKTLIVILIAGILLTSSNSMPFAKAQPTKTSQMISSSELTSLTLVVPYPKQWIPFRYEFTMEATLKDGRGNPLPNMDITFSECGGSELIGTAKTESNGVAYLKYTFSEARYYPILAKFNGTTTYAQSESGYVNIMIIDNTPYLIGGGLIAVAIIGVVGYIVFLRRKKAITMPMTAKEA